MGCSCGSVSNCHVTSTVTIHTDWEYSTNSGGIVGLNGDPSHSGVVTDCSCAAALTIAEGIQKAAQIIADKTGQDGIPVPVVVRLEGTNVERGRQILTEKPVKNVFMAPTMEGGAQDIVKRVEEAKKN